MGSVPACIIYMMARKQRIECKAEIGMLGSAQYEAWGQD